MKQVKVEKKYPKEKHREKKKSIRWPEFGKGSNKRQNLSGIRGFPAIQPEISIDEILCLYCQFRSINEAVRL
jgi:hypothetical protein